MGSGIATINVITTVLILGVILPAFLRRITTCLLTAEPESWGIVKTPLGIALPSSPDRKENGIASLRCGKHICLVQPRLVSKAHRYVADLLSRDSRDFDESSYPAVRTEIGFATRHLRCGVEAAHNRPNSHPTEFMIVSKELLKPTVERKDGHINTDERRWQVMRL